MFYKAGSEMKDLQAEIQKLESTGEESEELPKLKSKVSGIEGQRVFNGILLAMLSATLVGIVFVTKVMPLIVHKMTHAVYDSGEQVEEDPMHTARVLMAQGEWDAAIEAFKEAAQNDPYNRVPWMEIAKMQRVQLEDSHAALETLRFAIQEHDWEVDDAAFLMFRLAELYDEDLEDRGAAVIVLEQIMELFPETRHSANARTKLHEWGMA